MAVIPCWSVKAQVLFGAAKLLKVMSGDRIHTRIDIFAQQPMFTTPALAILTKKNYICKNKYMVLVLKKGASRKDIEALRKKLERRLSKGVDTKKYCGVIRLKEDPLEMQQKMRDEWE